jgi:hypothetical protein
MLKITRLLLVLRTSLIPRNLNLLNMLLEKKDKFLIDDLFSLKLLMYTEENICSIQQVLIGLVRE